jgi:hypothetical protein
LSTIEFHSKELPSWVPNWEVPRKTTQLPGYYLASGHSRARVEIRGRERMRVTGVFPTTVESVEVFHLPEYETQERFDQLFVEDIRRMATWIGLEGPFIHQNEQFEAFCRTLSSNRFYESYSPPDPSFPTLQQTEATISKALDVRFSPAEVRFLGRKYDVVLNNIPVLCNNRCFFQKYKWADWYWPRCYDGR